MWSTDTEDLTVSGFLSPVAGPTLTGLRLVVMMILCKGPASLGGNLGSVSSP